MLSMSSLQALKGIDQRLSTISMTRDEHVQFATVIQMIEHDLHSFEQLKQEHAKLKEEHAKCPVKSDGANPASRPVGSEGNGPLVGEGGGTVEADGAAQKPL